MEEFYKAIEDKIKASGYPGEVNGEDISPKKTMASYLNTR